MLKKTQNSTQEQGAPSTPMVLSYSLHRARKTEQSKKRTMDPGVNLASSSADIELFCQRLTEFKLDYQERYYFKGSANAFASVRLIKALKELLFSIDFEPLRKGLKDAVLKEKLQYSLLNFLKKFAEMDARRTAENNDISLQTLRNVELSIYYDSIENFKKYIEPQLKGSRKYLLRFRYLFPLGEEPNIPEELGQGNIKPFINRIESLFTEMFKAEEKDLNKEPDIDSQPTKKSILTFT